MSAQLVQNRRHFMLQNLRIKNFALIEDLEMTCSSGLNVLTGETGAGKSILIDALNILLGEKASPSFIRAGNEKAIIEGIFLTKPAINAWLKENEFIDESEINKTDEQNGSPDHPQDELTITREITKTTSRFRINSILANQASISELKQLLIHVHAQHESRTLFSAPVQLEILDGMAEAAHQKIIIQLQKLYEDKINLKKAMAQVNISEEERIKKLEFAKFQWQELQAADIIQIDEDEQLENKRSVLSNIAQLDSAANQAYYALMGGADEYGEVVSSKGAIDNLQTALSSLEKVIKFDNDIKPLQDNLANALSLLEDAQVQLRHYKESLDTNPDVLQELEERFAQLATIKRKYGPSLEKAVGKLRSLEEEIDHLENIANETNKIETEIQALVEKLTKLAIQVNKNRLALAEKLCLRMEQELSDLGMENCRFEIAFEKMADIGASGFDHIEFMISPNPGQPLMPLAKIASGGELSRIMLALKSIVANLNDPPTVIFDEIDAGLSGRIVQAVRDKLSKLAKSRQILCITHQPIIAAAANNHLFIEKQQNKVSTKVTMKVLTGDDRVKILAAMASGDSNESTALNFAQSLINQQSQIL